MIHHSKAVGRGAKTPFLVGDMPFGTYEKNKEWAVTNSIRFVKEGGVEGIKLEGGKQAFPRVTTAFDYLLIILLVCYFTPDITKLTL
jgi:3-methyl-2-oxobutanoate hydroxymethyltransferase